MLQVVFSDINTSPGSVQRVLAGHVPRRCRPVVPPLSTVRFSTWTTPHFYSAMTGCHIRIPAPPQPRILPIGPQLTTVQPK